MTGDDPHHRLITARLLVETVAIAALLAAATIMLDARAEGAAARLATAALISAQGCWLHRLYVVAHEAAHGKLWPNDRRINDLLGQLILLPLMLPLRIHRKIHTFHHGHNRRDFETSALDTFVVREQVSLRRRVWCHVLWYVAVFAGGFSIHSLISVVLFLAMPLAIARRISPALRGWRVEDQLRSLLGFGLGLALHLGVAWLAGPRIWALTLGWPLLAFAWVYSLVVPPSPTSRGSARAGSDESRSTTLAPAGWSRPCM